MVYTERNDKCLANSKDKVGQNPYSSEEKKPQSSPSSSGAWSSQASNAEKWKYNNMVKDNRDKFNGMHFS
ncbi:uncharacterized protein LOC6570603 [Drosophila grimshawi]|uniref:GH10049 n=1 Tax=Drosophila grimshawi TaxID=7222 RepID=B4JDJ4_DROGR|nr:uncharacterized protein LOC6570603 [Drosophila grimshawi]EDW03364.1 GH11198 [Drosophila grimshawi]EDW05171.1 GH10049 [Drosophila grimshawi]